MKKVDDRGIVVNKESCKKNEWNFPFRRVSGLLCGHFPFIKENRRVFL